MLFYRRQGICTKARRDTLISLLLESSKPQIPIFFTLIYSSLVIVLSWWIRANHRQHKPVKAGSLINMLLSFINPINHHFLLFTMSRSLFYHAFSSLVQSQKSKFLDDSKLSTFMESNMFSPVPN